MKLIIVVAFTFTYNCISLVAVNDVMEELLDEYFNGDPEMKSEKIDEILKEEKSRNSPAVMKCKDHYNLKHGETVFIQSPYFPYEYPHNEQCTWFIQIPSKTNVTISCGTFAVGDEHYLELGEINCVRNSTSIPPMRFYEDKYGFTESFHLRYEEQCLVYLVFDSDSQDTSGGIWCNISSDEFTKIT